MGDGDEGEEASEVSKQWDEGDGDGDSDDDGLTCQSDKEND